LSSHKNPLELYVAEKLKKIYEYSRPTIASGATPVESGDIKNPYFNIECKIRNTYSYSIKDDVWAKLKIEAARDSKDAVYIIENANKNRLAIMDLEDWCNLVYELVELREAQNLMSQSDQECPHCLSRKSIKFPCCGFLCLFCAKTFEIKEEQENDKDLGKT
jgi:hypothetical protein